MVLDELSHGRPSHVPVRREQLLCSCSRMHGRLRFRAMWGQFRSHIARERLGEHATAAPNVGIKSLDRILKIAAIASGAIRSARLLPFLSQI